MTHLYTRYPHNSLNFNFMGHSKNNEATEKYCVQEIYSEMYQRYMIFGPFCNTFASLFLEWPLYLHTWGWALPVTAIVHCLFICRILSEIWIIVQSEFWSSPARQTDGQKVMHMSPLCKVHRWAQKQGFYFFARICNVRLGSLHYFLHDP